MGISIQQYRIRIGRFLPRNSSSRSNMYSEWDSDSSTSSFSVLSLISLSIIITIILALLQFPAAVYHLEQSYNHPTYPTNYLQLSPLNNSSGKVSTDLSSKFLISYGINILATSSFSMLTNFYSRYLNGNRKNAGIKISSWNKGGGYLQNKMPEIKNILNSLDPHILGISEAELKSTQDQNLIQIDDYILHTCPTITNPNLMTSRVVVYTHKSLVVKPRPDLMCDTFSSVWMEVGLPNHKKFLVANVYREWQLPNQAGDRSSLSVQEQLNRWMVFLDQWERALNSGLEVHVLGDINLNHCNWTAQSLPSSNQTSRLKPLINALFSKILPHGVSQHVRGPTRHFPGQASTGLDHYYTNRPEKISDVRTQHCGGSDHMLVYAVRYSRAIKTSSRYIRRRCYKHFCPEEFVAAIQQVSWLDIYLSSDVNTAVQLLSDKITFILDTMAPIRTIQVRKRFAPWLSQVTLDLMKERDQLQKLAAQTRNRDDWQKFKCTRNKVNNRLKYEERNWQKVQLDECGSDSKKVWKNVKGILNWKSSGSPSQLFYKGSLIQKPAELAAAQNEYFVEKIETIIANMPNPVSDPLSCLKSKMAGRKCSLELSAVHPDEVDKIISSLSNSTSFGLDQIDTRTIKLIRYEILPALTHIVNLSISSQEFPTLWKKSKIIPLHKKDDLLNPKNYRPVAIIPIFSKVLERVIFNQIIRYMTENNLLNPNHHAYRANHNTTTALIQMYDVWLQSLESGEFAGVCFLDMSAAFDIVDHSLLMKKLELYGFESNISKWIRSYLADRSQAVCIDGSLSRLLPVRQGVPQGSILGPLLYTIFTNELPEIIHDGQECSRLSDPKPWPSFNMACKSCGSLTCYADDTTYSCSSSDPDILSEKLTTKYKVIADFMVSNRLKLNDDKTHLMVMTTSKARRKMDPSNLVSITTPTEIILPSTCEKLLGCYIHQDMKWSEHLQDNEDNLMRSLSTRLGALKLLGRVASFKNRKMIADGILISKLSYLIALWGGCSSYLMKSLQIIQNKAARVVTKLDWSTPTKDLLKQCGWLSVNQLAVYHSVLMVHKVMQTKSPAYLYSMFNSQYRYRTRQCDSGIIKNMTCPHLTLSSKSFKYQSSGHYNSIPKNIRAAQSLPRFKWLVKEWIKENISLS